MNTDERIRSVDEINAAACRGGVESEVLERLAEQIKSPEAAKRRTFLENGKIVPLISRRLPTGTTVNEFLRQRGLNKGTISNACAAATVFREMVEGGGMEEKLYDRLSWRQVLAIKAAVAGKNPANRLNAESVAALVRRNPDDFQRHLRAPTAGAYGRNTTSMPTSCDEICALKLAEVASLASGLSVHEKDRLAQKVFALYQHLKQAVAAALPRRAGAVLP